MDSYNVSIRPKLSEYAVFEIAPGCTGFWLPGRGVVPDFADMVRGDIFPRLVWDRKGTVVVSPRDGDEGHVERDGGGLLWPGGGRVPQAQLAA